MDAKTDKKGAINKYNKNKRWKKKYKPKNVNVDASPSLKKPSVLANESEESEDEFVLKQPIPEHGWFLEDDSSSSDSELYNIVKKTCDKNWFDKELDNVQLNSDFSIEKQNVAEQQSKSKQKLTLLEKVENQNQASNSKIKNDIVKKCVSKQSEDKLNAVDDEEKELEFLLSLKEPLHTGPLNVKQDIQNERKLAINFNKHTEQKPVKSIDLEKWLDSVLDE